MLIDSHVNLHAHQYDEDRDAVIVRAREAGIGLMVTICDKVSSFEAVHAIAMAESDIWCTVGTHPHEAKENPDLTVEALVELASRPRVIGIGECGLDFHYDLSPREVQAQVFRAMPPPRARPACRWWSTPAKPTRRWVRSSRPSTPGPFKILMHCYTSGPELAVRAAALGAWFSVSGIATFKQAEDVREIIRDMPADKIIVETDCPYLAPVPMRGRRNEPAYLPHIVDKLAEIRGWTRADTEARTEDAFFALFDRIPRP
jgi:TatD DNase family protein